MTCLPIIGTLAPAGLPDTYTATEPIGVAELREVIKAKWCLSCRTVDGSSTSTGCGTYYLLAEIDGQVLTVRGEFAGVR
ncbi:hypothetical protein [Kitasatospora cheerisanensis]|uniref:Uncharacterized protein n=1 Tax=Kitasatospora cheerisanensis KCTC 2395 TaxID=1348663 RepID=A0A066YGZ8_9ACTN|nr:hypothetical protein [Kitasatospora cheerisanensis]KDN80432.1 hypothetical protein KCH_78060 [Kitasatospora cheerisanensis KCTC 2395]